MRAKSLDFKSYVVNAIRTYKFYYEDAWKKELEILSKVLPDENLLVLLPNQFKNPVILKVINELRKQGDVKKISNKVEDALYNYIKENHGEEKAKKLISVKIRQGDAETSAFQILVTILIITMMKVVKRDWRLYLLGITF